MSLLLKFFPGLAQYALLIEIALFAALALAVVGYVHHRDAGIFHNGELATQAKWDAEKHQQEAAALAEAESNAKETQRRLERQGEAQREYDDQLAQARADAAAAVDAAGRLRQRASQYAAAARRAGSNPAPVVNGAPAADASGMLADVLGKAVERSRLLASYADAARRAGKQCERDYDSLSAVKRGAPASP